jgi:hypothetical protein
MLKTPEPEPMPPDERLLRDRVCSAPWADTVLEAIRRGESQEAIRKLYPPGGKIETGMRKCPECGKWCPPNGPSGMQCCDCACQLAEEQIREWAKLLPDLYRCWWPRGMHFIEFLGQLDNLATRGLLEYSRPKRQPRGGGDAIHSRKTDADRYRKAAEIAKRHLKGRSGARISPGCRLPVLPENEDSLQKEIAYYASHRPEVLPEAKEFALTDILFYWISLGVIPSATKVNNLFSKK